MKQEQQQPSAVEFIDFSLYGDNRLNHPVHKWLQAQPSFRRARQRLVYQGQDLDFAQRVSYCFGHYYAESAGVVWKGSSPRKRDAAARAYKRALDWCRAGFGPYAEDDRKKLQELLTITRDCLLGKHLSPGFRLKGGAHRSVGMLIRELVVFLDPFDFPSRSLNPVIADLVSTVADVEARTVERHVSVYKRQLKATDR